MSTRGVSSLAETRRPAMITHVRDEGGGPATFLALTPAEQIECSVLVDLTPTSLGRPMVHVRQVLNQAGENIRPFLYGWELAALREEISYVAAAVGE